VIFVTFDEKNILKMFLIFGKERGRVGRVVKEFFRGGVMGAFKGRDSRNTYFTSIAVGIAATLISCAQFSSNKAKQYSNFTPSTTSETVEQSVQIGTARIAGELASWNSSAFQAPANGIITALLTFGGFKLINALKER